MTTYKCPECGKNYMAEDRGFTCLGTGCNLNLPLKGYLTIAAAILNKPLNLKNNPSIDEYRLPEEVVNKILEVLYSIKQTKEEKLKDLSKKGMTLDELREFNKDGGLALLLDS